MCSTGLYGPMRVGKEGTRTNCISWYCLDIRASVWEDNQ